MKFHENFREMKILTTLKKVKLVFFSYIYTRLSQTIVYYKHFFFKF
jgi:hypothetical protein